jgi:hypothetical protein
MQLLLLIMVKVIKKLHVLAILIRCHHHFIFKNVEKKFYRCSFVNIQYIHIKYSNKYDLWVTVKSLNIGTGAWFFFCVKKPSKRHFGDESISLDCMALYGELSCFIHIVL